MHIGMMKILLEYTISSRNELRHVKEPRGPAEAELWWSSVMKWKTEKIDSHSAWLREASESEKSRVGFDIEGNWLGGSGI